MKLKTSGRNFFNNSAPLDVWTPVISFPQANGTATLVADENVKGLQPESSIQKNHLDVTVHL